MLINPIKTYTYKDYLTYDENERIEIIDGGIYNMSPAPSRIHQEIITEIHFKLRIILNLIMAHVKFTLLHLM